MYSIEKTRCGLRIILRTYVPSVLYIVVGLCLPCGIADDKASGLFLSLYCYSWWFISGPSPGPVVDLGTKSRGIQVTAGPQRYFSYEIRQPRDWTIFLYGIRPPRYFPGRDVATTGRNGIWVNGMQPREQQRDICTGSVHRGTPRSGCSHDGTRRDFCTGSGHRGTR